MDEQEARENVRPLGNVYPLEPEEKPYPEDALASRAAVPHVYWPDDHVRRRRTRARIANLRTEADELERRLEGGEC